MRLRALHPSLLSFFAMSVLLAMVVASSPVAQAATITVINRDGAGEGFNDPAPRAPVGGNSGTTLGAQRFNAFQHAANIWGGLLDSPVTILVGAQFDPLTCGPTSAVLGAAGPTNLGRDFAGAPVASTWYPIALANALSGVDLIPGPPTAPSADDIVALFNSSIGTTCPFPKVWYYGLDGNSPSDQIDFVTVVLHELGHGLGFMTVVNLSSGAKLGGFNDAFMRHLEHHGASPAGYPSMTNAGRVAASMDTGNLHWIGPAVRAFSGVLSAGRVGDHVRMFAPNPQRPGSSVSHWDTVLGPNQLMEPSYNGPLHDPALELPLFFDIGWTVVGGDPNISVVPASKDFGTVFVGTSTDQTFTVRNNGIATLQVSGTSIDGPFSILGGVNAFNLEPGEAQLITVRFTPTAPAGLKNGTLQFTSDDPDTPDKDVALSGTAALPTVTIVATDPTASESTPNTGTFTVSRSGSTTFALIVNYTVGGTAGNGVDYTALSGAVTIPVGARSAPIVVTPIDDTLAGEGNENVVVTLTPTPTAYIIGGLGAATVTMVDKDQALQFTAAAYQALEGAKLVPISVTRVGPVTAQVTVKCRTVPGGTAISSPATGADYTPVVRTLVFAVGVRTVNCMVPILNDAALDGPKTVFLQLDTPAGAGANLGSLINAVLTIADNRAGIIQFAVATATVGEGLQAGLKVIRTGVNLVGGVTVDYSVIDGTATNGPDYNLAGGTLTFDAGVATMQIPLPTEQDSLFEGDETVIVRLSNVTGLASLGPRTDMTVTIRDDEQVLQFTAVTYQVMEGAANAVIGVRRVGPVTTRVTVLCSTVPGGTAVPNQDYRDVVRTIVFEVGVRTRNCLVPILNDTLIDGATTVNLALSNPLGSSAQLGSPSTAELTINDNDRAGTFRFDAPTFTVTEGGTGLLKVVRSGINLGRDVTVDYAVTGGSATGGGTDYTLANGTLTFGASQTSATIRVPTTVDALFEGGETVVVMILNPSSGGTIALPAETTLTIREGTRAQVRFLNGLCINPGCQSFTARLRAEEGYTWFSVSGVSSAYQNVKRATLSNFVGTAVEFPTIPPLRFFGSFAITPNRRYRLVATISGGNVVLLQIDEGAIPGTSGLLELEQLPVQSIPADMAPRFRFGPVREGPAPALISGSR